MIDYPDIPLPSTSLRDRSDTPVARTQLRTGLIRQRPRFSTGLRSINVSWQFTRSEFAVFENWFANDLAGGVLVFGIPWNAAPDEVYRFAHGRYEARQDHWGKFAVSAALEVLETHFSNATTVPPVAPWLRLVINPVSSQQLTFSHRNARLTANTDDESTTTLRVYNPTSPDLYIPFGIRQTGLGDILVTSEDADPPVVLPPAVWPSTLPAAVSGFTDSSERPVARIEMDGGHVRQAQRFDASAKEYNASWDLSAAQLQTFETFFHVTLQNGSREFTIPLPVDGTFNPVPVRFNGGYATQYQPVNRFRVTATLDRVLAQSVSEQTWTPFGLYYKPVQDVVSNLKVTAGMAGRLFRVYAAAGQTVSLHIGSLDIEFGILSIGPGSVLITRAPYLHNLGEVQENMGGAFLPPTISLGTALIVMDDQEDPVTGEFQAPTISLQTTLVPLPEQTDSAEGAFLDPVLELREVLVPVSDQSDSVEGAFLPPVFFID